MLNKLFLLLLYSTNIYSEPAVYKCKVYAIKQNKKYTFLTKYQLSISKEEYFTIDKQNYIIGYKIYHKFIEANKDINGVYNLYHIGKTNQSSRYSIKEYKTNIVEYMENNNELYYSCKRIKIDRRNR